MEENLGYKIDVTQYVSEFFDNVKQAFLCSENSPGMSDEELVLGTFYNYETKKVIRLNDEYLNIEFNNGKRISFYSRDLGEISIKKERVEQLKADDQKIVDNFEQFMSNFWKISDLNKEAVEDCNKQVQDAQEIYNYIKKFPADLYLALFHIMQQEITGLPCSGSYCV